MAATKPSPAKSFRDAIRQLWSANADELLACFDRTLATGEPTYLAELRDDERGRTYEWHMERLPLPNGSLGVVCYFRDVTQHVEARAELLRQREELQTIYDTAPVGLCVIDRASRFVRINKQLADINGLPVEAHIGRTVREVLPGVADAVEPVIRRILEAGHPVLDYEVVGETPAQPGVQRVWIENWYPIRDASGTVSGINVVAREVTEQRRATEELRRQREELERTVTSLRKAQGQLEAADRQKDEFLAMLAHELRNPLTPIANACELMARTFPDHRDAQAMVGMVRRQVVAADAPGRRPARRVAHHAGPHRAEARDARPGRRRRAARWRRSSRWCAERATRCRSSRATGGSSSTATSRGSCSASSTC